VFAIIWVKQSSFFAIYFTALLSKSISIQTNRLPYFRSLIVPEINDTEICWIILTDSQHLLIGLKNQVLFLKIDYELCQINIVSRTKHRFGQLGAIINQIGRRDFVMYDIKKLITASVINDKVVFGPRRNFRIDPIGCPTVIGNHLCGFRGLDRLDYTGNQFFEFYKLDLVTLNAETRKMPFKSKSNPYMPDFFPVCFRFSVLTKFRDTYIIHLETCFTLLSTYVDHILSFLSHSRDPFLHSTRRLWLGSTSK
jgi:hypothetical protein